MSEDGMSAAEEFARVIEDFTASDKERQLRVSRDSFRDGYKRCQTELETARSTIAEQEKRIAELEGERDTLYLEGMDILNRWKKLIHVTGPAIIAKLEAAEQALTTERQRREEAEAEWRKALAHIRTEVGFANRDEREGVASENTRKLRFEYIEEAIAKAEALFSPPPKGKGR